MQAGCRQLKLRLVLETISMGTLRRNSGQQRAILPALTFFIRSSFYKLKAFMLKNIAIKMQIYLVSPPSPPFIKII